MSNMALHAQVACLFMYAVLVVLFAQRKQYAISLYYMGCIVKDLGVFVMAVLNHG